MCCFSLFTRAVRRWWRRLEQRDCGGRLVLCAVTAFWAPSLSPSQRCLQSSQQLARCCRRRAGAALEKPAEAPGRQSARRLGRCTEGV